MRLLPGYTHSAEQGIDSEVGRNTKYPRVFGSFTVKDV
jgi:hypothetical protein